MCFAPSFNAFVVKSKDGPHGEKDKQKVFTIRHRARATSLEAYAGEVQLQLARAQEYQASGIVPPNRSIECDTSKRPRTS